MMKNIKKVVSLLLNESTQFRKIASFLFPRNTELKIKLLKHSFLEQLVLSYYDEDSIIEKRFFNVGAGNQRSKFNFWSYIDLESSKYSKRGIDIFYDLESLSSIPVPNTHAEVIFNSFVIEHISIEATKNLCKEAYRILKKGGVFHSKVHSYEYGIRLLNKNVISPNIPFECRESVELVENFIRIHKNKIKSFFNEKNEYVIQSLKDPNAKLKFDSGDAFVYYNATAAVDNLAKNSSTIKSTLDKLDSDDLYSFYGALQKFVDTDKRQPHQHNADYFSKEDLYTYIKDLGFSEVYFTQPYQSVSPALWEDMLNPIHHGFLYSIEAVK